MKQRYSIAGFALDVEGEELCKVVRELDGFAPFEAAPSTEEPKVRCIEMQELEDPAFTQVEYRLNDLDEVQIVFGTTEEGYRLELWLEHRDRLVMWTNKGSGVMLLKGALWPRLVRFALWIGFGLGTCDALTVALHSSCIVHRDRAVLFLGESGTGKSTHTRLWREHIAGAHLLNDDSPLLRVEDDGIWIYGSPWSGKTPCYHTERYLLQGCVRLSQAPENVLRKLKVVEGYAALHPSCPPAFACNDDLYNGISATLDRILQVIPCFRLACLPNKEAALLAEKGVFETIAQP